MPESPNSLTLLDLGDILIVSVLVYQFALLLKKETAVRLLVFLLIFFITFYISLSSGFYSTTWILRNLFSALLIIMAIIFHVDLRRAFQTVGRRQPEPISDEVSETVEELIRAVSEMALKRIGALIVIVRQTPIDHLLEIGTEIDAKVTSELLNSIFLPYSPIHDGAVIIQKRKLTKAGCLLPLSQNPDISKSFGTRHRAALGLSELVDALIMVVSEETGKISLVHDGKINYDVETSEIRQMLRKAFDGKRALKSAVTGEA